MDETRFTIQGPPVIHQTLDGEVIVVNLESGTYYSLDGVAAEIWDAVARDLTLGETAAELAARHGVSLDAAAPAVHRFVAELAGEELVIGSLPDAPAAVAGDSLPEPRLNKFTDMQELLVLDPIHEVDERGWPNRA